MRRTMRIMPAVLALVAWAAAFPPCGPSTLQAADKILAIKGGTILTMAGKTIENGVVLVRNGRITAVGKDLKIPGGAEVIDAAGKYVMPGIVDAMTYFGIQPFNPNVPEPVTPENRIIEAFRPFGEHMKGPGGVQPDADLVGGGVTTVYIATGSRQLVGGQGAVVKTDGLTYDSMILREPASIDMTIDYVPYGATATAGLPSRMSTLVLLRKTLAAARKYQKGLDDFAKKPKKEKAKTLPPARDLGNEALARLFDGKLPARIEADFPEDILNAVQIADEFKLGLVLDGGLGAAKVADTLARKKIPVVLGPLSHPIDSLRQASLAESQAMENEGTAAILTNAGVKVAIASRASAPVVSVKPTQGRWLLIEAALAMGAGLTEEDALKAVTINPAEILGVANRVGSLAPGKDADIVILSGHPLKVGTLVERVFIDGRLSFVRQGKEGIQ